MDSKNVIHNDEFIDIVTYIASISIYYSHLAEREREREKAPRREEHSVVDSGRRSEDCESESKRKVCE